MFCEKCTNCHELKVLRSGAGFYVGTVSGEGFPHCRISSYFSNRELADEFLAGIIAGGKREVSELRHASENIYCSGGASPMDCLVKR